MDPPKVGYGLPARPSDGHLRRLGDARFLGNLPRPMTRAAAKEADTPGLVKDLPHQSRLPSRVPLPLSSRRAPTAQTNLRPVTDRQSKSWGSTTSSSSNSRSHTQTESGSSSSSKSYDGNSRPGQPVLRRKKSSLSFDIETALTVSTQIGASSPNHGSKDLVDSALGIQYDREITESPIDLQPDDVAEMRRPIGQSPVIYPELDRYRHHEPPQSALHRQYADLPFRLATHDLPPPTPGSIFFSANSSQISALSGSPSTKFSESPGPGSYSRDTTPTSFSSQSPGLIAPSRVFPLVKARQQSPSLTRPPVTRRRTGSISNEVDSITADPHGLAAVRESLTSSSSNSTVKDGERNSKKGGKAGKALLPPPPSPPPRKSSQKFAKSPSSAEVSPPKQKRHPEQQAITESSSPVKSGTQRRPQQGPSRSIPRPNRPSRDGTPDLKSQLFNPVPVIQSNLVPRPNQTERRGSESSIPASLQIQVPQTSKSASTSHLPIVPGASLSEEAAEQQKVGVTKTNRSPATPSPNIGASSSSRFPFFGRRKNTLDSTEDEKKEKKRLTRKGPAAGTGHEGYGRIGAIRRRSGTATSPPSVSHDTKLSKESLVSNDSFLSDRVNPVIISGGGVVENWNNRSELSRTESSQSLTTYGRPSTDSNANSVTSSASRNASNTTLWPSAMPRGLNTVPTYAAPTSRRPSDSSESSHAAIQSTLAFRRSIQRLRSSPDSPLQLPQPINTAGIAASPMTSFDASIVSDESSLFELQPQISQESGNMQPLPNKLRKKKTRSPRRWNLFSRSQSQARTDAKGEKVEVTVQPVEKKPLAYYAIMDSPEHESEEPMDVKEALRNADVYANESRRFHASDLSVPEILIPGLSESHLSGSGSPHPSLYSQQPTLPFLEPPAQSNISSATGNVLRSGRPSRLPQVGRIPQVVSNRIERASPISFSRPFGPSPQPSSRSPELFGHGFHSITPGTAFPFQPQEAGHDGSTDCATEFSFNSEPAPHISPEPPTVNEFLAFSPRKNSDSTNRTSSSESGVYNYAEATAVIPKPDDPPAEDEVWDEYDDLLGGEENVKARQSATSSKGTPFHLETYHSRLTKEKAMESPTLVSDSRKLSTLSEAPTASTTYSADMTERIRKAFQPHPSPTMPLPVPEDREESDSKSKPQDTSDIRHSTSSSRRERLSNSSTSSEEWSPLAQVNLRVGSMTVSKWLTFGHVLFSDIRHELVGGKDSLSRPSVLVVDGLGNDDWSFYAAETYPAANFFNLSPRAPIVAEVKTSTSGFPLSPPNHHQIQYSSHLDKFPFGAQSFTCVVYRFPVAAPEAYYRNIISEARRVLKPGGFIELSILDVDLNNMGNRGRRTVRQLKERNHEKTPETILSSTADLMVRLLGRGGFSTIKAARVGVPVASSIAHSKHDLKDRDSSDTKTKVKDQPSLAEMMRDQSPTADEGITSMVARVGRWWYARCYENLPNSSLEKSIWSDKALLRECEELGTSLKFMVCCARAPDRINSV